MRWEKMPLPALVSDFCRRTSKKRRLPAKPPDITRNGFLPSTLLWMPVFHGTLLIAPSVHLLYGPVTLFGVLFLALLAAQEFLKQFVKLFEVVLGKLGVQKLSNIFSLFRRNPFQHFLAIRC